MNEMIKTKTDLIAAAESQNKLGQLISPLIREIYLFDSYVAGTFHLEDKSVLDEVKAGDKLLLRREDNKFDSNAILILTQDGRKLGYVPEKDNIVFARLMDAGKALFAKINGIEIKGSFHKISVGIFLEDF